MSDWDFLNKHRAKHPRYPDTDATWGFNGYFVFFVEGSKVRCVASDGEGWQHVSVSLVDHPGTVPTWKVMCGVKDLFFEPEEAVVQFHPRHSQYVNHHAGCLHLWRPTDVPMPEPPAILVGPK